MLKKRIAWILAAALMLTSVPMPGSTARASESILPIEQESEQVLIEEAENALEEETEETLHSDETREEVKASLEKEQEASEKKILTLPSTLAAARSARVSTGSIVSMPETDPEPLSVGEYTATVLSGGTWYSISITDETEGGYRIYSTSEDDTYVEVYRKNKKGKLTCVGKDDDSGEGNNFQLTIPLKSGNEYFYKIRYYSDINTGEVPYTFEAMPRVKTLSVTGNAKKAVPGHLSDFYSRLQMDLTYDNGETAQSSAAVNKDRVGNPVKKTWYADAAGETVVAKKDLEEGKNYFLSVSIGSARSQMLEVQMCAPEEVFDEIKLGDQELVGKRYYKIVVDDEGDYTFDMQSVVQLEVYNSQLERCYINRYDTRFTAYLNSGINYIKSVGDVSLNIRKTRKVQSIKLVQAGAKIVKGNRLDSALQNNGCKFQVTYEGGTTEICGLDAQTEDGLWLTIYNVTDANGQWVSSSTSKAGNYKVTVYCQGVEASFDVQIYPVEQVYTPLQLGDNVLAETDDAEAGYYFKAPAAGKYRFRVLTGSGRVGNRSFRSGKIFSRTMKKDAVYSFAWTSETGARIRVEQMAVKTIQSVQADPLTYICAPGKQKAEQISLKNGVKVTYTDGTTEYVQGTGNYYLKDKYGNKIYWDLYKANKTESVSRYRRLRLGEYYIRLYGSFEAAYVPVKVLAFSDAKKTEMKAPGTVSVKDQDAFCGSFTPQKDGKYMLYADTEATLRIVDINGAKPEYYKCQEYASAKSLAAGLDNTYAAKASISTGGTYQYISRWFAFLKAGTTYQFYAKADNTKKYSLMLEEAPAVTDMSLQLGRKEYLAAGLEHSWDIDSKVKLSYSDGTAATLQTFESDLYGNRFNYEILKDGNPADLDAGLQRGEYLAKVSLCTSSMVAEAGFKGVEIQEDKLKTIKEEEWLDDIPFGKSDSWYLFTPQKSGMYSLNVDQTLREGGYSSTISFYKKTEQGYIKVDGWYTYDLQAGTRYVVNIFRDYDAKRLRISHYENVGKEEIKPVDGGTLTDEVKGKLTESSTSIIYTFTPDADGEYLFRLNQDMLYLAIERKSDSFCLDAGYHTVKAELMAGTVYTVTVNNYDYDTERSFTLTASRCTYKQIREIQLKRIDDKPISQQSVSPRNLDDVWAHMAAEITYIDGEKDTLQLTQDILNLQDRYGTIFQSEIEELPAKETGTSCVYRYRLYTEDASGSLDIPMTKAAAIKLGTPLSFNVKSGDEICYEFVAPESGVYYINRSAATSSLYIYSWPGMYEVSSSNGLTYNLKEGMRYSVYMSNWSGQDATGTVTITKSVPKTVSDVEIIAPAEDEIYHPSQAIRLKNLKVKLTYRDGSSQTVDCTQNGAIGGDDPAKIHDGFGNILWFYLSRISYKASQLVAVCGGYRASQVITHKDAAECNKVISSGQKEGSVTLDAGDDTSILKFTPGATAGYKFAFMLSEGNVMAWAVLDENQGELPYRYVYHDGLEEKLYWMEAGKEYYIVLTHNPLSRNTNLTYRANTADQTVHMHQMVTITDKQPTCGQNGSQHRECTICGYREAATIIKATGRHTYGGYVQTKEATALAAGTKMRTCTACGHKESAGIPKLAATMKVNVKSIVLQMKQSTTKVKVTGLAKGDYVKSWKSNNQKVVTVTNKGKIKAGKKTGSAKITITLASGKKAVVKVKVQKKKVTAKSIKVKKTVTLKAKKTFKLQPIVSPLTCQDKLTYTTSDKKVAAVNKKGVITGRKKGKAIITVKCGKKKVKVKVTVK